MPGTKHTKMQRGEIRSIIAELDRRGYENNRVVADILRERHGYDMTPQMVWNYKQRIMNEYLDRTDTSREEKVAKKLQQLRMRQLELMEAWDLSRGMLVSDMAQQVIAKVKQLMDANMPIPDTFGIELGADPAYPAIKLLLETYKEECELEGLYAPKQQQPINITNNNTAAVVSVDWSGASNSNEQQAVEQSKRLVEMKVVAGLKELPNEREAV